MAFYDPICLDQNGGFFHYFKNDGEIYDQQSRHLVSSTRFVFNYAMASMQFDNPQYLERALHGLNYINHQHFNSQTGGYYWLLKGAQVVDDTHQAYGMAFVLLANATAYKAGIKSALQTIHHVWNFLEVHFWESSKCLYKDELDGDLKSFSTYRGQNSNMHLCEALISAYEATNDRKFLDRALVIAKQMVLLSGQSNDFIWEHYDENWNIDWDYHKENPKHLFRPWGFQPGHQIEWAKLLLLLHRHTSESWMIVKAKSLFNKSFDIAWDKDNGGLYYGFDPEENICDSDKYFWVQAEAIATAALLAVETANPFYWRCYHKLWNYCWSHFVDHQYGAWYRILDKKNQAYDDLKSPAGKTDYHTMGACYEVLKALKVQG